MSSRNWERIYDPIDGPDGSMAFEHKDTLPYELHHVWSLIDGESGQAYVVPGYHIVNVFGYAVTKNPWTEADMVDGLQALW